ncbi:MAG: hypothetical protein RL660_2961 [Bacteroidota bacterium]|jgi:hypothetical protein
MKVLGKVLDFVLYSNLFISVGAALAMYGTAASFGIHLDKYFYTLLASATCAAYCLHWYFTDNIPQDRQREQWSLANRQVLIILCSIAALVALVVFGINFQLHTLWCFLPLVVFTFLYSAPKLPQAIFIKLRPYVVAKTIYLTLGWWYATSLLPFLLTKQSISPATSYLWYRFWLILAICFVFDFRDKRIDLQAGIKSLLKFISHPIAIIVVQILLAFACVALSNSYDRIGLLPIIAHALPVLALAFTLKYSFSTSNDRWYYGVLDALLFVSGIFLLLCAVLGLA